MKTHMSIFVPQLNILKTVSMDIKDIDKDNPFELGSKKYYKVEPYCFTSGGGIITAIAENQLAKFETYQSSVITDTESILHIFGWFDIMCQDTDLIASITVFNGYCDRYEGEQIAVDKMVEYLDNLKSICVSIKNRRRFYHE